jgi:hypothetical protein
MKSTKAWDLMAVYGMYVMPYAISSKAHLAIHLVVSQLLMISPSGKEETIVIGCKSK